MIKKLLASVVLGYLSLLGLAYLWGKLEEKQVVETAPNGGLAFGTLFYPFLKLLQKVQEYKELKKQ